uniref:Uncharacterized protein n=1 Tax=viral metagenome TaxID=1070528 RepID=A0A6C0JWA8_9ZZZZ
MLRINDVATVDYERKRIRKETYKRIYEQFCRKIKQSTEMGYKYVLLTIPSFLFGFPSFDRGMALIYLERQFRNGGFEVYRVEPYSLYISWVINNKKQKPSTDTEPIKQEEDIELPTLINLKKAANRYRKGGA